MSAAFNADSHAQDYVCQLIARQQIKTVVETGTYHGVTTEFFAPLVPQVYTIEARDDYRQVALSRLQPYPNVHSLLGDSAQLLPQLLPQLQQPLLLFLDAHWGVNPLRGELEAVARFAPNSVIMIHDFLVPGTDLGYDEVSPGQPINLSYIIDLLPQIYPQGYELNYNSQATGSRRGIAYFTTAAE